MILLCPRCWGLGYLLTSPLLIGPICERCNGSGRTT